MLAAWLPDGLIAAPLTLGFVSGGRSLTVEADGFAEWRGGYSANVIVAGQEIELSSSAGDLVSTTAAAETEMTPQGAASVTARTIQFPERGIGLNYRLGKLPGTAIMLMQAGITNRGKQPVQLVSVTPMRMEFAVNGSPSDWWITALNDSVQTTRPVVPLTQAVQPITAFEHGGFYRKDGKGFLFAPVGSPVAYVNASIKMIQEGRVAFSYTSDMSRVRIDPGETRWGQQVALLLEPPREALAR